MLLRLLVLCVSVFSLSATAADNVYVPKVAPASREGEVALKGFKIPPSLRVSLYAAEPLMANPVAFCLDEQGRVYVAETFRQKNAIVDNRDYMYWLDDDLAAMTVADRLAYHQKYLKDKLVEFTKEHDRIRLLEDTNGDGVADVSHVFTTGYNSVVEGTGAGVLARQGRVWYTNIPHLWSLRDTNGDGEADEKQSLLDGFGVRVAFRGHDMHGLRFGPDGRLYFSIGDRGFNVETPHRKFVYPEQGAVFRCEPDGSNLEMIHQGLRNPQELAFDHYGNLFTGDNNSDSGDKARWVYVVEGGDSGWRMSLQYLNDRGPWNREKMWHPAWEGQPAFLVPPITNFADGPSGLTYYPGTGLPEKYRNHFFLCDFRGGPGNSGVRSFSLNEKGASFELVDSEEFVWKVLATDVEFGPDSAMYISDWVDGWNGEGKGRLYKIDGPDAGSPLVRETRALLGDGFAKRTSTELLKLLGHPNQQVRQGAQFALADLGETSIAGFVQGAMQTGEPARLSRLHAIWGLGQIARPLKNAAPALTPLVPLLTDNDVEVRTQAAKVLGDVRFSKVGAPELVTALTDDSPRVRFHAAISAGKVAGPAAIPGLIELLRENADKDPYLRHAGVMGLSHACNSERDLLREPSFNAQPLTPALTDPSPAVRLAAVLVLRRYSRPEISQFLSDADPRVVEESARAISDALIVDALPALAKLAGRQGLTEPALWRVINANFRLGTADNAMAVAALASRADIPEPIRIEALRALSEWEKPSGRDRVLGLWRPLPARDVKLATDAFRAHLGGVFAGTDGVRRVGAEVSARLGVKEVGPVLFSLFQDGGQPAETRVRVLEALQSLNDRRTAEAVALAIKSDQPLLRAAGRSILAVTQPDAALPLLEQALKQGELVEQQMAIATLGKLKLPRAEELLLASLVELSGATLREELHLDLLEAARGSSSAKVKLELQQIEAMRKADDPVSLYRECQSGGDSVRGKSIFFERTALSCVRCHKIMGQGGEVGPDLSSIALQQKRDYLLTALVDPNKHIAKGYETVIIELKSGKTQTGIVRSDDGQSLKLITAEGQVLTIHKSEIEDQARGKSAMPEDLVKKITRRELRDLVEFLAIQKAPVKDR